MKPKQCRVATCRASTTSFAKRFRKPKHEGYRLGADWYCSDECLDRGLVGTVQTLVLGRARAAKHERGLRPTLGLLLMQQGKLTKEDLAKALEAQKSEPTSRIGDLLKRDGVVSEREVTLALSRQYALPWVNFVNGDVSEETVRLIPAVVARTYTAVPVDFRASEGELLVAIVGPPDYGFLNGLSRMLELDVTVLLADESKLRELLARFYPDVQARGRRLELRNVDWRGVAEIIGSMAREYRAKRLRLERCGERLWLRFERDSRRRDFLLEVDLPEDDEVYVS